jgi:hypothetical protein
VETKKKAGRAEKFNIDKKLEREESPMDKEF